MRKKETAGLADSTADFFASLPDAGLILDREGRIISCNRLGAAILFGTKESGTEECFIQEWLPEEYQDYLAACLLKACHGQIMKDCRVELLAGRMAKAPFLLTFFPLNLSEGWVGVTARQTGSGVPSHPQSPASSGAVPVWAAELPGAWKRGELELYYQPQWNIVTGELIGMEALLRWNHPRLGLIPPMEFIPYAEETDWIVEIGEWVMREAAHQNKRWQDAGYPKVPVSVNCSVKQFGRTNIVGTVFQILKETGLEPQYLKVEITESVAMHKEHDVVRKLNDFQNFEVRISIDDFGTGYSSLSYLYEMPVQVIKLDRSFLQDVETNPVKSGIVRCILDLAKNMNVKVMAEGLETLDQLNYLTNQGCEEAQGYYMNRPMTATEIEAHWRGSSLANWQNRSRQKAGE